MDRKIYVLGSGHNHPAHPDVVRCDILPGHGVDMVFDLDVMPWPIADGAAMEVNASHIMEHLKDPCRFMDELWRITYPGGQVYIETPDAANFDLAWCDPTHKRPFRLHTFLNYFTVIGVHRLPTVKHGWEFPFLHSDGNVIKALMLPLSDEYLTNETLARLTEQRRVEREKQHGN